MTIDRFGERYLEPAAIRLANMIDGDLCDLYLDVFNFVGTPGTTPTTLDTYTSAGVKLANSSTPVGMMRSLLIDPLAEAKALGFQNNLFNPVKEISEQYRSGKMGEAVGFKWSMDQNIARQTVGTTTGSTPVVNGANQSGSSIITNGWAASTTVLKAGDIISFAGVNAVNPISYRDTGARHQFTVLVDVTSDGAGNATIPFSPALDANGADVFQTVVALPATGATIYVYEQTGSTPLTNISGVSAAQCLAFHKNAFVLAIANLDLPGGLDWSERVVDPKTGFAARLTRGFSIETNQRYTRFEVLGGVKTVRPEWACRIAS